MNVSVSRLICRVAVILIHPYSLTTSDSHRLLELHCVYNMNEADGCAACVCVNVHHCYTYVCSCQMKRLQADYTNQTSQATMNSVWMKNLSVPFTYSSRRKIFLQGCPPEMWRSHARRPAATLPTRFSIKQANNTIPTPINKWSFLNKVLYTQPLTEATHHTLMEPCTGQTYFSPLSLSLLLSVFLYLWAEWGNKVNGGSRNRWSWGPFRSSSSYHWLRYSPISFMIYETINMHYPPPSLISFMHIHT